MYCSNALIKFGVRFGLACSISATVPVTTGAAMLVPLSARYGFEPSAERAVEQRRTFVDVEGAAGTASETVPTPGATRSGFASKSTAVGPDELKSAISSSLRVSVPIVLEAPTVSTHGALPGAVMPPYCN